MLQLSVSIYSVQIVSLRTSGIIASAERPIINPNNLKVEGWFCQDKFNKNSLILLVKDVREVSKLGLLVDDYDVLTDPSELIRLRDIIEINYQVIGKQVVTDKRRKLGKINDYAIDTNTFIIQKLYVTQPVYKTISGGYLSIDRQQIVEVSDSRITVRDTDEKVLSTAAATA